MLAAAIVWVVVPIGQMIVAFRTPVFDLQPDGTLRETIVTSPSQLVWAITGIITALGLGWALVSSFRGRLRRRSWMPVVCLLLVVAMVTLVARDFQPPVG